MESQQKQESDIAPYRFPDWAPRDTLQVVNGVALGEGDTYAREPGVPTTIKDVNANPVTDGAYTLPGHDISQYRSWPWTQDLLHREISISYDEQLLYRSNTSAIRRESPMYRIRPASVTAPGDTTARFLDGTRGDTY